MSRGILGLCIVLSLVLCGLDRSTLAQSRTFPVGARDIVVDVADRTFDALLRYPATSAGPGVPVAAGRHPVVVFGHGYLSPVESYASTFDHLASAGYIVVAPRSSGEPFPDHAAFARDLALVVPWLAAQDVLPDGPLEDRIDVGAIAVAGHSMGGGAAILAAADEPAFVSVVTLAAAETRPSAISAAARIHVPTLFIAGELDAIAPVDTNQRPMFEALRGAPARLEVIPGGSHCGFIDPPSGLVGGLTALVCDSGTTDRSVQLTTTWSLMTDWLAGSSATGSAATPKRWVPRPTATFQYQLSGTIDRSVHADVFDIDAFDTTASLVRKIHASGRHAICYIDAGSWETYRPDADRYPDAILGKVVDGWPDERWVDIRQLTVLKPIIRDRVDRCASKGFDGVEYDWADSYVQDTGFPITRADQPTFDQWLARLAHDRGLSVGLKNTGGLVKALVDRFDFVVTEECFQYHECSLYKPFRDAGKAHFDVEYRLTRDQFCAVARRQGISATRKHPSLGAWRRAC